MKFNKHLDLVGQHALLSASKFHWINYDEDKLAQYFSNFRAAQVGTELHAFASKAIELGIPLQNKDTLGMYVNDAIGFKMTPELVLYYSPNCFCTADAISYRKKFLRIHDYKSGVVKAHMEQLYVNAAIFCLEYHLRPRDIECELRIYQNNEIRVEVPNPEDIEDIMAKIISFDKKIEMMKMGV